MREYILNKFKELGQITERTVDKYATIDKSMMHFIIKSYKVEGVGYLSILTMKAMLGLMKMDTIVFTPYTKDMPLLSYDKIKAMGNTTLIIEAYNINNKDVDLSLMNQVKSKYSYLEDHDLGSHWYDDLKMSPTLSKKGKKLEKTYDELSKKWVDAYIETLKNAPSVDQEIKKEKTKAYVDGLFENGGPSTDQFIKMIGKEEAYELFTKFIFSSDADNM